MSLEGIPKHIAIVMDGNGRWASCRSLPRLAGHNSGMKALKEIVKHCSELGIEHLTVYAFSTENWKRPHEEISGIFKILVYYVDKELAELHENNVKVGILGDYSPLPKDAVKKLEEALEATQHNTGLKFHIALNYGSRGELTRAVKLIADKAIKGDISPDQINEAVINQHLFTKDIPDPDLVIRTSGEKRLSNFLLWQCAYSEFIFSDVYWPDFTPECLDQALIEYRHRVRRFGGVR